MNEPQIPQPSASRRGLESVGTRSREALFVVSARTRRIAACNKAAERLFGHPCEELIGHSTEPLHADNKSFERFCDSVEQVAARGSVVATRRSLRRRDGTGLKARDRIIAIDPWTQADLVLWLVREAGESSVPLRGEIVERDLLRMAVARQPAVNRWTAMLERFATELEWAYAEAWLPRAGRMALTAWWSVDKTPAMEHFTGVSRSIDFAPGEGLPGRTWRSGDIEWLSDISEKPESVFRRTFVARSAGLRSWFAVPAGNGSVTTQVVVFAGREPRRFDREIATLAEEACQAIATATATDTLA